MAIRPSAFASGLKRSGIREIMDLAGGRPDVLHLEVGDPDFATPAHISRAGLEAALAGETHYTANKGFLDVRRTIADKLRRVNGLSVDPEQIVITAGAVGALEAIFTTLLDPGDGVLVPDPGWPNYGMMIESRRARVLRYTLHPTLGFAPSMKEIEATLEREPRVRAILLNTPSNPTGSVFAPAIVEAVVDLARRHDLVVVSDDVYEDIVFSGERQKLAASYDTDQRVISVFSVSKSYAMTGWRLGYLVAPRPFADEVAKIQETTVSCASSIAQRAAQAAIAGDQRVVAEMRDAYAERARLAVDLLRAAGVAVVEPAGAFYCLVDVRETGLSGVDFAKRLLTEHGVAVAPGETFGPTGSGHVRLSFATQPAVLRDGCMRLAKAIRSMTEPVAPAAQVAPPTTARAKGGCACGAVRYEVTGVMREPVLCHCTLCRRHGSIVTVGVAAKDFRVVTQTGLARYRSSDKATRHFCGACGSALWWEPSGEEFVAIFAGSLEQPTSLKIAAHIFCNDKPDYYDLEDHLPKYGGPMYD